MRLTGLIVTLVSLLFGCWSTRALAQVVQLPSVHTFSYSGSVLVPDSGSASLGGRSSSASGTQSRLGSRARGSELGASGTSVHATIIDLDAMDRRILGDDPRQRRADQTSLRRTQSSVNRTEEGKQLVRFARAQFRSGNTSSAFDAYRMAIDILPNDLRILAITEMRRVFPVNAVQVASARSVSAD